MTESSTTLSSSDISPGQFAWPSDMFALKTVEVDFTSTGGQNFLQADKLDISNLQGDTSFSYIRVNQPTTKPVFTNHGDTGEVFPTVKTSALLRIYYYLIPTEYTAVTSPINYPQSLDYRILGDKILIGYYESLEKWDAVAHWQQMYDMKIKKDITILAPQSQQPIKAQVLRIDGFQF